MAYPRPTKDIKFKIGDSVILNGSKPTVVVDGEDSKIYDPPSMTVVGISYTVVPSLTCMYYNHCTGSYETVVVTHKALKLND